MPVGLLPYRQVRGAYRKLRSLRYMCSCIVALAKINIRMLHPHVYEGPTVI